MITFPSTRRPHLVKVIGCLLAMTLLAPSVLAQEAGTPSLRVTYIDVEAFPDVQLFLQVEDVDVPLEELPLTIEENNDEIDTFTQEVRTIGLQTALIVDASGSLLDAGLTGQARNIEINSAVRRLIDSGLMQPESDLMAAYAPQQDGNIAPIQSWTRDHGALYNELYLYQPPGNPDLETPLYDLIFFALDRMELSDVPPNLDKSIVMFSDGLSGTSNLELDDAVNRAAQEGVRIHTVLLGEPSEEGERNMRRIATLTDGRFFQLSDENSLTTLWERIAEERDQLAVSYRSPHADPRELAVAASLTDGSTVAVERPFPAMELKPVEVEVVTPDAELDIVKDAPAWDTPLEALTPDEIQIEVDLSWPDGDERELERVEYIIGDDTQVRDAPPFDRIDFSITALGEGRHTLRVVATDELGLAGESEPLVFTVDVNRPPQPTPLPPSVRIPGTEILIPTSQATGVASLLALALGVAALIIALRKPTVRERIVDAVEGAVKAVTEPFMFNRQATFKGSDVKAKLIVEDRGRAMNLASVVDIRGGTTRFGRASEYANVVIDDPRVSRYHCRITESPNQSLVLYDEGGSSGTYVNFEPVAMEGHTLQSNDIINIGPIQFVFKYVEDLTDTGADSTHIDWENKEATEPYSPYDTHL